MSAVFGSFTVFVTLGPLAWTDFLIPAPVFVPGRDIFILDLLLVFFLNRRYLSNDEFIQASKG